MELDSLFMGSILFIFQQETWTWKEFLIFGLTELILVHLMTSGSEFLFSQTITKKIPIGGKHYDTFLPIDYIFVYFNKFSTTFGIFCIFNFCWNNPQHVEWDFGKLGLQNTIITLFLYYIVFDFFYFWFHYILHMRHIYAYIHKHHHKQHAPSRGYDDSVNVHPIEFNGAEFLHLFVIYLIPGHFLTVLFFLTVNAMLVILNHSRYDFTFLGFDSKAHDMHHRIPTVNFGQYLMIWDRVFNTFKPYLEPKKLKKRNY